MKGKKRLLTIAILISDETSQELSDRYCVVDSTSLLKIYYIKLLYKIFKKHVIHKKNSS